MFNEPEKELDAAPVELIWPEVLTDPAVKELVTVNDLAMLSEPRNELEAIEF